MITVRKNYHSTEITKLKSCSLITKNIKTQVTHKKKKTQVTQWLTFHKSQHEV